MHTRAWCTRLLVAAALLVAAPGFSAFPGSELFLPAVGRGDGNHGSHWYTTVWLHNPGSAAADVTLSLLLRDQGNPFPDEQVVTVPAGSTVLLRDALAELYGLDAAVGALRVRASAPVVVGARVFNQPGASIADSQGQLIAGIPTSFAVRPGESTDIPGVMQPADGSFRCNFGMVETSGVTAHVAVTLFDGDGVEIASHSYTLDPYAAFQRSLASLASGASVEGGRLHVAVEGHAGAVIAYASVVGNGAVAQDPTTLEMNQEAATASGGGTITGVSAGPGLSGGGTSGEVTLAVKAGDGIAVSSGGVALRTGGIRSEHVAPGQLMLGTKVGGTVLHDVVTLEGGSNVSLSTTGNTVTIAATGGVGERLEVPVATALTTAGAGSWSVGGDRLELPSAGRWRVGYRVMAQVNNLGIGTTSDPVTVALVTLTGQQAVVRGTLSVVGLQVGISPTNQATLTVSGEAVITVGRATTLALAGRSSSSSLQLTVLPHDADVAAGLPAPDGASFLWAEDLGD